MIENVRHSVTEAGPKGQTFDPFYPIFDRAAWLERMLPLGVRFVQLRIKDLAGEALTAEIRTARDLCVRHNALLVVNDHWQAAIEAGCPMVHLGQEDLDDADVVAIRRAGLLLGISTHDHAELDRALAFDPDYIALGPIYPTILKQMKWDAQGLDRLAEWRRLVGNCPLCAIGGFTVDRAAGAFASGADFVSVVTDITLHPDPEARVAAWIDTTAAARAALPTKD